MDLRSVQHNRYFVLFSVWNNSPIGSNKFLAMNHHQLLNDASWLALHNKCLPFNRVRGWNLKFTANEGDSILNAHFALQDRLRDEMPEYHKR